MIETPTHSRAGAVTHVSSISHGVGRKKIFLTPEHAQVSVLV